MAVVMVVVGLFAAQGSYGFGTVPGAGGPQRVSVAELQNNPQEYLGERLVVEGFYQGGLVRDANPLCANTREGVPKEPYHYVFVDVRVDKRLTTGVKYRFVGTLRPSSAIEKPTIQSRPFFVITKVERLGRNPEECSFLPTTDSN